MNHTVLSVIGGDPRAREALSRHLVQGEHDKEFCARGARCAPWKQTEDGIERHDRLGKLWREHQESK